jgi:hypothetical protein
MALMKKDMGGAAVALALAHMLMSRGLRAELQVLVPIVENSIGGNAYRPGDVLATRKGLSVEVGNTDAEGRLVLCDALALADAERPDLIIDFATLTGAARVALGPELPALFGTSDALTADLARCCAAVHDPVWPMPLWMGYDEELGSKIADLNNVASSGLAGAIFGALFLRRFITASPDGSGCTSICMPGIRRSARTRRGRRGAGGARRVQLLARTLRYGLPWQGKSRKPKTRPRRGARSAGGSVDPAVLASGGRRRQTGAEPRHAARRRLRRRRFRKAAGRHRLDLEQSHALQHAHRRARIAWPRPASKAQGKAVTFNTITVSDGISMGTQGMRYSLVSREVIADSIETVVGAQGFDGVVAIGGCDKNMPGCLMALARLDRPAVFVYGGTIRPGADRRDIVSVFEAVGGTPRARSRTSSSNSSSVRRFPGPVPAPACTPPTPWPARSRRSA